MPVVLLERDIVFLLLSMMANEVEETAKNREGNRNEASFFSNVNKGKGKENG